MTNPVVPQVIYPLPPAPAPGDSVTDFDAKAYPFVDALSDYGLQFNQTAQDTNQNAVAAKEGAFDATAAAADALDSKNSAQAAKAGADAVRNDIITNTKGWSPLLRAESDGTRRVMYLYDWTGGAGIKPSVLGYIGPSGIVSNKAAATDVRGLQGLPGSGGDLMQVLAGLDTSVAGNVTAVDSLISAIGKLQGQLTQMPMAGPAPNQVPANQMLGAQAFADVVGATQVTRHVRDSKPGDVWHEYVSNTQLIKKFHGDDNVIRSITETYA